MIDNYNNNWNNDDYQNQSTQDQRYFNFTETHLQPKKQKRKMGKAISKMVALMLLVAILSAGVTGGAIFFFLPDYINTQITSAILKNQLSSPQTADGTQVKPVRYDEAEMSVSDIAKHVGPAVVGVVTRVQQASIFGTSYAEGGGSGIIISKDGYIITNNHVIEKASEITVKLSNGEDKPAKIVGSDSKTDLAVIKIEGNDYHYAELGTSSVLEVGDRVVAIGNPFGVEFAGSVTVGYVSALNRNVEVEGKILNLIQTDAAINSGNSGGALVDSGGRIIGINTVKLTGVGVEGLGFSIPIDEAKPIVEDLLQYGYVKGRPVIGIGGRNIPPETAKSYNYPEGIFVDTVSADSGAARAGIKRGDIITHIDGNRVKTMDELNDIKDKKRSGDTVTLEIDRSGEILNVNVILGEEARAN